MKSLLYLMMAIFAFYACDPINDMDSIEVLTEPKQEPIRLTVSPTSLSVSVAYQVVTATISSNGSWTATCPSWCQLSAYSGTGNYSLRITVGQNTVEQKREGVIKIYYDNKTASITITQQAKAPSQRDPSGGDNTPPSW